MQTPQRYNGEASGTLSYLFRSIHGFAACRWDRPSKTSIHRVASIKRMSGWASQPGPVGAESEMSFVSVVLVASPESATQFWFKRLTRDVTLRCL